VKGFSLAGTVNSGIKEAIAFAEGNDVSIMSYKLSISAKSSLRANVSVESVMGMISGQTIDPDPDPDPVIDTEPCELPPYIDLIPSLNANIDTLVGIL
jgi:hypothetical protein